MAFGNIAEEEKTFKKDGRCGKVSMGLNIVNPPENTQHNEVSLKRKGRVDDAFPTVDGGWAVFPTKRFWASFRRESRKKNEERLES